MKLWVKILLGLVGGVAVSAGTGAGVAVAIAKDEQANRQSLYEDAVELGFEGSYEEFIAHLMVKNGADGKDGEDGKSAYEIALANGFVGSAEEWIASFGKNGLSAYEVALNTGFVGEEKDWLESLKGERGEKGESGEDGENVMFRSYNGWLQWKYTTDESWKNLYEIKGEPAPEGLVTVKYMVGGGVMPSGTPQEINVTVGTSIVLPTPSYHGYTFMGWYLDLDDEYPVSNEYRVHQSENLYAKWEAGAIITGKKIYNLNDLANVKNDLGGTYVLMNNIDCDGLALPVIGTDASNAFRGIFEGQGYTISNYVASGGQYVGLFGYSVGTIRNLHVENFKLEQKTNATYDSILIGGITGFNAGKIQQCSAENGTIYIKVNNARKGGLIAAENTGTIENCWATGSVRIEQQSSGNKVVAIAGGIVGDNYNIINNCWANAQLYAYRTASGVNSLHGQAALISGNNNGRISSCLAFGCAEGRYQTGDICCESSGIIDNCYKDENLTLVSPTHTYATAMSLSSLSKANFYSLSLKWDATIWQYENVNMDNGVFPQLKYSDKNGVVRYF